MVGISSARNRNLQVEVEMIVDFETITNSIREAFLSCWFEYTQHSPKIQMPIGYQAVTCSGLLFYSADRF